MRRLGHEAEAAPAGETNRGRGSKVRAFLDDQGLRRRSAFLILISLAVVAVLLHMRAAPKMSPIDEMVHSDYMIKASQGHLLRWGELIGPDALHEEACRGLDYPIGSVPPCADNLRPEQFASQAGAFNYEAQQPPLYYVVTGGIVRVLHELSSTTSLVTLGRLVGALWLAGGMALLWTVFSAFGIPLGARLAAGALVIVSPGTLEATARINNDATAFAAGAGVLAALLWWERGRLQGWVPVAAAILGVAAKETNLVGVGIAVLVLLIPLLRRRWGAAAESEPAQMRTSRATIVMAVGTAAAGLLTALVWSRISGHLATAPLSASPLHQAYYVNRLDPGKVLHEIGSATTPFQAVTLLFPLAGHEIVNFYVTVSNWVALGACFAAAAFAGAASRLEAIGIATLVGMVLTGPGFALANFVATHEFAAPTPQRYGASAMPALAVLIAAMMKKRVVYAGVAAIAASATVYTFWRMLFY